MSDDDRYSNQSAYDAIEGDYYRLTWQQVAANQKAEIERLSKWARICSDLDRCEHGRHEGDVCGGRSGCNGPSLGNKLIGHAPIGHTMDGAHIFSPPRSRRSDPDEWLVDGGRCSVNNHGRCPINSALNRGAEDDDEPPLPIETADMSDVIDGEVWQAARRERT